MKIYVFGNPDFEGDNSALTVAKNTKGRLLGIEFVIVKPNEDLPFANEDSVVILDAIEGIKKVLLIDEEGLYRIKITKSVTAHDYDLGFQLKYLKKLGKLKKAVIIGVPMKGKIDYLRIQSILRKFVAQEIQGS